LPTKYAAELILLAAIWGASFLFMRSTSAEFGPIMLITLRTGIAALVDFATTHRAYVQTLAHNNSYRLNQYGHSILPV
jgi:drug/metabolite transporter (DMT)-like permease